MHAAIAYAQARANRTGHMCCVWRTNRGPVACWWVRTAYEGPPPDEAGHRSLYAVLYPED